MDQATFETIAAMKQQEAHYATVQGLYDDRIVNTQCRYLMVEWCNNLADFCKYNHSTADIAINCLNRFLMKQPALLEDRRAFQLAAMTCFYTAVKVHESVAMDPVTIAQLSKGVYSEREIEIAEAKILKTLQWRVNPPTATCFATEYLKLFPQTTDAVKEIIQRQLDVAVKDASFLGTAPSATAFAAVVNAIEAFHAPSVCRQASVVICEALGGEENLSASSELKEFFKNTVGFQELQSRPNVTPTRRPSKQMQSSGGGLSPVCVTMQRS